MIFPGPLGISGLFHLTASPGDPTETVQTPAYVQISTTSYLAPRVVPSSAKTMQRLLILGQFLLRGLIHVKPLIPE